MTFSRFDGDNTRSYGFINNSTGDHSGTRLPEFTQSRQICGDTPPSFAPKSCPQTYSMPVSRRNTPEKNRYQHDISLKPIEHHCGKFPSNLPMDNFLDIKKAIFHIQQQIQNLFLHLPKINCNFSLR